MDLGTFALPSGFTGAIITPITTGIDDANSVVMQPDGKLLVGGTSGRNSSSDRPSFTVVRYNVDGSLDTSFGQNGKVITLVGTSSAYGQSILVAPDGKVVVTGYSSTARSEDLTVVRYNADGSLDASFNGSGKVTTSIGVISSYSTSAVLQPDGKLVAAGWAYVAAPPGTNGTYTAYALTRYNADGSLDTSFGGGTGKVTTRVGVGYDFAQSVALQSDGKLVVTGYSQHLGAGTNDIALVRYNSDGSLDTSFGDGTGKVVTVVGTSGSESYDILVQPDGKLVVSGFAFEQGSADDFAIVRYNANGSLDTGFGVGGKVTTAIGAEYAYDVGRSVALQPDGKLVVAGYENDGPLFGNTPTKNQIAVVRYNADGSLDMSFGQGTGKVTAVVGPYGNTAHDVLVQPNGKIVIVGNVGDGSNNSDFVILRFNADGSPDATFEPQVNHPPSGSDGTVAGKQNTIYIFNIADFGFSDIDGNLIAGVKITSLPAVGQLGDYGVAVAAGQIVPAIDIVNGAFVFTPVAGGTGSPYANFTFQVQDAGGTANGGVDLDPTPNSIAIAIGAANIPPITMPDVVTVAAGGNVSGNLLGNDSDPENAALSVSQAAFGSGALRAVPAGGLTLQGFLGTLLVRPDGSFAYTETAGGLVAGVTVDETFSYAASDGPANSLEHLTVHVVGAADGTEAANFLVANPAGSTLNGFGGDDLLEGQGANDILNGGDGADVLEGNLGNDTVTGGAGSDLVSYYYAPGPVTVSLANTGPQNTGSAGTDTISGVENLLGSNFADVLTGDGGTNVLIGAAGRIR